MDIGTFSCFICSQGQQMKNSFHPFTKQIHARADFAVAVFLLLIISPIKYIYKKGRSAKQVLEVLSGFWQQRDCNVCNILTERQCFFFFFLFFVLFSTLWPPYGIRELLWSSLPKRSIGSWATFSPHGPNNQSPPVGKKTRRQMKAGKRGWHPWSLPLFFVTHPQENLIKSTYQEPHKREMKGKMERKKDRKRGKQRGGSDDWRLSHSVIHDLQNCRRAPDLRR